MIFLSLRTSSQGSSFSASPFLFIQQQIMGNQICIDVNIPKENQFKRELINVHAPDPHRFPQVGDDPSSLPCDINHMRQQLINEQLKKPQNYEPSPFRKDSFYEIEKDKAYYKGQWRNGWPNGLGEVIFKDKSYFRGYITDAKAKGPDCIFVLRDGSYYRGGVSNSKRDGKGTFIDKEYKYEGEWLNNLPHGNAEERFENGDSFEGKFVGGKRKGEGIYRWGSGDYLKYEGIFEQNTMTQRGVLSMRDGQKIEGIFDCNQKFDIQLCQIKAVQYELKNCVIDDGYIQQFQYKGDKYSRKPGQKVFSFKRLFHCDKDMREEAERIVKKIEEGYKSARKHSEAIHNIQLELKNYNCSQWKDGDIKRGVIVEICGKTIIVSKKY